MKTSHCIHTADPGEQKKETWPLLAGVKIKIKMVKQLPAWIEKKNGGLVLDVKVIPNAAKTEIIGEHAGQLKIKVNRPPDKDKANTELIAWLAKNLSTPKSNFQITKGLRSRNKTIFVQNLDAGQVMDVLGK